MLIYREVLRVAPQLRTGFVSAVTASPPLTLLVDFSLDGAARLEGWPENLRRGEEHLSAETQRAGVEETAAREAEERQREATPWNCRWAAEALVAAAGAARR